MNWGLTKRNKDLTNGFDLFRRDISRVFDDFFTITPSTLFEADWVPTVDVEEDEKAVHVKAEVPGIEEKDLNVTLEDNVLTISGEKNEERKEENKKKDYIFSERKFGSFSRSIALPDSIKSDKVKATFKKGVLKIEIPKDEAKQPKKISINVN